MIVTSIIFDRVTVYKLNQNGQHEKDVYEKCLVRLNKDDSVYIQVSKADISSNEFGNGPVMVSYRVIEFNPKLLVFDAKIEDGEELKPVYVMCEFDVVSSKKSRVDDIDVKHAKPMYFGNRKCEACGWVKSIIEFHGHKECDACVDEAREALSVVEAKIREGGYCKELVSTLIPSKNAYMKDYLARKKLRLKMDDEGEGEDEK